MDVKNKIKTDFSDTLIFVNISVGIELLQDNLNTENEGTYCAYFAFKNKQKQAYVTFVFKIFFFFLIFFFDKMTLFLIQKKCEKKCKQEPIWLQCKKKN